MTADVESGPLPWAGADDLILPFRTVKSGMVGKIVRLGGVVDEILSGHDNPEPVNRALGEAIVLTSLLGSGLKADSRLILQTKTDGPLGFLVVNYEQPGRLRGYASCKQERLAPLLSDGRIDQGRLIGKGHLALTIDPGGSMDSHQGIVALTGKPLIEAAHEYFRQSEQIPTFIRVAVARHYSASAGGWSWRAGGLMVQHLVSETERVRLAAARGEGDEDLLIGDDDHWQRVSILAATVEDHELLDPLLAPDRLLLRLFHEEGVRAGPACPVATYCRCSRDRIRLLLKSFGPAELSDMVEPDGCIAVKCEFCTETYRIPEQELE